MYVNTIIGALILRLPYVEFTTRLPGPPISNDTSLVTLLLNKVVVGIGTADAALAAHTRFDIAWVKAQSILHLSGH